MITAALTVCPARLVPAPRGRMGTWYFAARLTAACTSSRERGINTPYGWTW